MRVLITGGAGFIGSHLTEYHLAKGDEVFVVDDLSTGTRDNISHFEKNKNLRFEVADILTWPGIWDAGKWADRVYHLAAVVGVFRALSDPIKVLATNVAGCERLLRAVHLNPRKPVTLIASSSEVYGFNPSLLLQEENDFMLKSSALIQRSYAISKLTDEAFAVAYATKFNDNIIIVRLFNTIGPRQTGRYGMVVPRFIKQAVHNKPITIYGDGKQRRSFCDVRDTITMLDRLTATPLAIGKIINVGNSHEVSIEELAQLVRALTNSQSTFKYLSYQEAYGMAFEDTLRRKPDLTRLHELISYDYRWTLTDTLKDLIGAMRKLPH